MSLNKGQKRQAFDLALDVTKAYGNCGTPPNDPHLILRHLYAEIKTIMEDLVKTAD
jgi:hypothetical protein